jgi:hypothetical protein
LLGDLAGVGLGWVLALWIRFEGAVPPWAAVQGWRLILPVVLVHAATYFGLGFYRRLWQYTEACWAKKHAHA